MNKLAALLITLLAPQVANTALAQPNQLKTQTEHSIALSIASYQYHEPGLMSSTGSKLGLEINTIKITRDNLVVRGDFRYAGGTVDYSSVNTGSAGGEPDWYIEARGLLGKDFYTQGARLSPYIGLGYRYLFNDARGLTTTGHWGYRRESNYFYLPLGLIHHMVIKEHGALVSTLEYDQLLTGKQISHLSDGGTGYGDVTNKQSRGYGVKLSILYQGNNWALGPYAHYWNIKESDWSPLYQNGRPVFNTYGQALGGVEPDNNTVEIGWKVTRKF